MIKKTNLKFLATGITISLAAGLILGSSVSAFGDFNSNTSLNSSNLTKIQENIQKQTAKTQEIIQKQINKVSYTFKKAVDKKVDDVLTKILNKKYQTKQQKLKFLEKVSKKIDIATNKLVSAGKLTPKLAVILNSLKKNVDKKIKNLKNTNTTSVVLHNTSHFNNSVGTNNNVWHSDGICNTVGNNYGLQVENNNTYSRIIHLKNTEDPDCVYIALHDKDNFASGVEFVLDSDLDFSGANMQYDTLNDNLDLSAPYNNTGDIFLPIGKNTEFNATFLGNNHKITIGNISYPNSENVGFFGYIGSKGKVFDLNLKVGNIIGIGTVGGFVGENGGIIKNSSVVAEIIKIANSVSGDFYMMFGGFVGSNYGTISNSSVIAKSVSGIKTVGGFVGGNIGTIKKSSTVVSNVSGKYLIGGFVGGNNGTINNSLGKVNSVNGFSEIGGFVGGKFYNSTISSSSAVVNSVNNNY